MGLKETKLVLLLVGILGYVLGDGRLELTKEEDHMVPRKLNNPVIKTIKTRSGDIFDCTDINKQPSLSHPLLKNHTVQLRPSSYPEYVKDLASSNTSTYIKFESVECPEGTVPIRRTLKSDLVMGSYPTDNEIMGNDWINNLHAGIRTYDAKYKGAKADINVYALRDVPLQQQSSHQVWIIGGPGPQKNFISAGWRVNPSELGDRQSRLFTYWSADGKAGCYNTKCPGFVHVNQKIGPSSKIFPVSSHDGLQVFLPIFIFKDRQSVGQWWLLHDKEPIGYWPKELFTNFDYVKNIEFGGRVQSHWDAKSPPMGSGLLPEAGWRRACCIRNIMIVNEKHELEELHNNKQSPFADAPNCYKVGPYSYQLPYFGHFFYFGGPGGC